MKKAWRREAIRNPNLAVFIVLVSVLAVLNTILYYFPTTDPALVVDIFFFNVILEVVFIYNFLYRFFTAKSKVKYIRSGNGIIDLLACVPFIEVAWVFRGLKAYAVVRSLGYDQFKKDLSRERAEAIVYMYLFVILLVLEFGSYSVLVAERSDPTATIKTAQDAVWYTYVTITTVGYGDFVPTTLAGRFVGALIMTFGIGIYAIFIGYFAKKLIGEKEENKEDAGDKRIAIDAKEMTRHQQEMEKNIKELSEKLGRIEQQMTLQQDNRK